MLGIDSCESNTPGGREATAAAYTLQGGDVILTTEPGVDTDRYDRLLRYVQTGTGDYGEYMVRYDHTGVYQGRNDASAAYIERLYAADLIYAASPPSGRECGEPDPPAAPAPDPDVNVDMGDDDDDGGESRFCRRRWWC